MEQEVKIKDGLDTAQTLSDINCWLRGYIEGKEDDDGFLSGVLSDLRELNIEIRKQLTKNNETI